jgi:hypothetical protein
MCLALIVVWQHCVVLCRGCFQGVGNKNVMSIYSVAFYWLLEQRHPGVMGGQLSRQLNVCLCKEATWQPTGHSMPVQANPGNELALFIVVFSDHSRVVVWLLPGA